VFFEGIDDFKMLRRFASRLEMNELATGVGITAIRSEGASSWLRMRDVAWGIEKTLGDELKIGAIFDKDFRCQEEIEHINKELNAHLSFVHIHRDKEIENYLLNPAALDRSIKSAIQDKARRTGNTAPQPEPVQELLDQITAELKEDIQGQYIAKRVEFLKTKSDLATTAAETMKWFEENWRDTQRRLRIVPGKQVLQRLRSEVQRRYGVSITDLKIIDSIRLEEVPDDIRLLLQGLEEFRTQI
jgi:hypothetical protein